jgi:RNA polymerase sigma-70 factor, ECF subfamily
VEACAGMSAFDGARLPLEARLEQEIPALRAYLVRLAGRDAEDLAQEVLARALRYRDSFDAATEVAPWLRRIALRVWIDQRRRAERNPVREGLPAELDREGRDCAFEARDEIARALAVLSAVEREIFRRFHGQGLSVREIADALAMPENTVKSHLHRARRALADRIGGGER